MRIAMKGGKTRVSLGVSWGSIRGQGASRIYAGRMTGEGKLEALNE